MAAGHKSASVGATTCHAASLAGSLGFWAWADRKLWFFGDEWDFLVRRGIFYSPGSRDGIWFPHNEHWSTLPILGWRALYALFHLQSYWPYLLPLLLAGTAVVHLGWRVALNAGADPWVATFSAGLLAFLGSGAEEMTSAFQVTFVGSVLFGLLAFVLLGPHAPARRRRDALASLCLLGALMCSTVGDAMLSGAAIVLFARRPARTALAALAFPTICYATWFAFLGRPAVSAPNDHFSLATFTTVPGYVLSGLSAALGQSANWLAAGGALLVALAAWVGTRARWAWQRAPEVLGLAASAVSFYVLAALGRDQTAGAFIVVSRYVWVAMALLLPVVAVALSGTRDRSTLRRPFRVAAAGILAASAVGNVGQAQRWAAARSALTGALRVQLEAVGELLGAGVPDVQGPAAVPLRLDPDLTTNSIAKLEKAGVLPHPVLGAAAIAEARSVISLASWDGSRTALTPKPIYSGHFRLLRAEHALSVPAGRGCTELGPRSLRPPMQVLLRPPLHGGASVEVAAAPAATGVTNYLGAALLVPGEPAPAPVQLAIPARGRGYLDYNGQGGTVKLSWDIGAPLELCGLSPIDITRRPLPLAPQRRLVESALAGTGALKG